MSTAATINAPAATLSAARETDPPSPSTLAHHRAALASAPWQDQQDLQFAERGYLGTRSDPRILDAQGRLVWDLASFDFLQGEAPPTVHPSLWRQAGLLARHGLFEVSEHVYQVRGFDLSNITFIRGETGWIVIDALTTIETAQAAYALVSEKLGHHPVSALIYTHSHVDHFGGASAFAQALLPGAPVLAPEGFLAYSISENVIAGPAMVRRAHYQFGIALGHGATGSVSSGLGPATPKGTQGLIAPTRELGPADTELVVDGVTLHFQLTPNTEAPAEMNIAVPAWKLAHLADNATPGQHNILTPRGAQIRDTSAWADGLSDALELYAGYEVLVFGHGWPRWGAAHVADYLGKQRDAFAFLHDQTVRLMNQGFTGDEIAARLRLPEALAREWYNRPYYGDLSFNARAVYQYYLGWYDSHPVHLAAFDRQDKARRYVQALGGAARVRALSQAAYDAGDYAWAAELLQHAVFADPQDGAARTLQARAFEQLAWQTENAIWRNSYLSAAAELRHGVKPPASHRPNTLLVNLTTPQLFRFLAVQLDPDKVGEASLRLGFVFPERQEAFTVTVAHAVLTHRKGLAEGLDASLTIPRAALIESFAQGQPLAARIATGEAQLSGDAAAFQRLASWLDRPDPAFAIVTP